MKQEPFAVNQSYIAFLSYRHMPLDKEAAELIQKKIENYIVPKEFRGRTGGKKLGHVFRDEDDLPASASLTNSIYDALDHSEYLIVICTPDLPKSRWCEAEIRYFIKTHDRDHVIAVLVDGKPEDSFSPFLLHTYDEEGNILSDTEPLAANIAGPAHTINKKAFRKEVVRLYAALIGCPFDSLWQRDRRARQNRLLAMAGAGVAVMAVFLGVVLNRNAQIEERNRQINEQNEQIREQNQKIEGQNNELQTRLSTAYVDSGRNKLEKYDAAGALTDALAALENEDPEVYDHRVNALLSDALGAYLIDDQEKTQCRIFYEQSVDLVDCKVTSDSRYALLLDRQMSLRCLELETRTILWEVQTNELDTQLYPDVPADCVICKNKYGVTCLSLKDGVEKWSWQSSEDVSFRDLNSFQAVSQDGRIFALLRYTNDRSTETDALPTAELVFLNTADGSIYGTVSLDLPETAQVNYSDTSDGFQYAAAFSPDAALFSCILPLINVQDAEAAAEFRVYVIDMTFLNILQTENFSLEENDGSKLYGMEIMEDPLTLSFAEYSGLHGGIIPYQFTCEEDRLVLQKGEFAAHSPTTPGSLYDLDFFYRNETHLLADEGNIYVFSDNTMFFFNRQTLSLRKSFTMSDTIVDAWWQDPDRSVLEVVTADGWIFAYTIAAEDSHWLVDGISGFQMNQEKIKKVFPIRGGWLKNNEDGTYLTISEVQPGCLLTMEHIWDINETHHTMKLEDMTYSNFVRFLPDSDVGLFIYDDHNLQAFDRRTGELLEGGVLSENTSFYQFDEALYLDANTVLKGNRCFHPNDTSEPYVEEFSFGTVDCIAPKKHLRLTDGQILSWDERQVYLSELSDEYRYALYVFWMNGELQAGDPNSDALLFQSAFPKSNPVSAAGRNGQFLIYGRRVYSSLQDGDTDIRTDADNFFYILDTFSGTLTKIENPCPDSGEPMIAMGTRENLAAVFFEDGHLFLLHPAESGLQELLGQYIQGEICSLCFTEGDEYLLVLTVAGVLDVYDTKTASPLFRLTVPTFKEALVEHRNKDFYFDRAKFIDFYLDSAVFTEDGGHLYLTMTGDQYYEYGLLIDCAQKDAWTVQSSISGQTQYDPHTDRIYLFENNGTEGFWIYSYPVYSSFDLKLWAKQRLEEWE